MLKNPVSEKKKKKKKLHESVRCNYTLQSSGQLDGDVQPAANSQTLSPPHTHGVQRVLALMGPLKSDHVCQ